LIVFSAHILGGHIVGTAWKFSGSIWSPCGDRAGKQKE
jgi:hypothetical protein